MARFGLSSFANILIPLMAKHSIQLDDKVLLIILMYRNIYTD